jgi:hypothetical protein
MRTRHLVLPFVLAAAAPAYAQVGMTGLTAPNLEPAPVNLDPAANNPLTGPASQPIPQQQQQPNIVVVGPDGKISNAGAGSAAPSGYYVTGDRDDYEQDNEIHGGPVPELHVVRQGDTLWGICGVYFNDPWQWPKIWSYNAQITNPHWIYPGDLVRLLPRGVFKTDAKPDAKPADPVPPPTTKLEVGLKQVAFVEQSDLDRSIEIDGSVDEKTLLGDGDSVYLSYPNDKPPQVGQRYSIYKPDNSVKANGKTVGAYVHIYGVVEVVSVKQDKRARGVIVEANHEIERGLKVGPLVKTFKTVDPKAPEVDAQGNIVAMITADQLIGQGELIMVDLGKSSGLEVGNRMFVVRRGDARPDNMNLTIAQDDRRFPARALGEVVIVEVGDKISIGLVTLAVQEMGIGDIVMMQKSGK